MNLSSFFERERKREREERREKEREERRVMATSARGACKAGEELVGIKISLLLSSPSKEF